jgi:transposase
VDRFTEKIHPVCRVFEERTMARKSRVYSLAFKRQVAREFIGGETLYSLAKRHEIDRTLIRNWARKYEEGSLNSDARMAGLVREYENRIAALEQLAGKQALEIEFLKGALKTPALPKNATTSLVTGPVASASRKVAG